MLSKRLEAVAAWVPQGARVADIGCDHAYLPIALLTRGQAQHAIGCDINAGPLAAARKNAARAGCRPEDLELRLADGLKGLAPGEVDVVTIAGMGAGLMTEILSASPEVVAALSRIVVSPNVAPWLLRRWAVDHGFAVAEEGVVEDGGHYYEVFVLEPAEVPPAFDDAALYFGFSLPAQEDAVTAAYFAERKASDARLLAAWEAVREKHPEVAERYARLSALWQRWEAMQRCK